MLTTSASLPDGNICKLRKLIIGQSKGFRISNGKMICKHFFQLRKMHKETLIKLEDTEIPVGDEYKFLGVIFDWKITFISHIEYLKTKSTRAQ